MLVPVRIDKYNGIVASSGCPMPIRHGGGVEGSDGDEGDPAFRCVCLFLGVWLAGIDGGSGGGQPGGGWRVGGHLA